MDSDDDNMEEVVEGTTRVFTNDTVCVNLFWSLSDWTFMQSHIVQGYRQHSFAHELPNTRGPLGLDI